MPHKIDSFKLQTYSTVNAFVPFYTNTISKINKKIKQLNNTVPTGAYQVFFKPETGEYFYVTT